MKVDKAFGVVVVVFRGDSHQILPIVHHGNLPKLCSHAYMLLNYSKKFNTDNKYKGKH